MTPNHLEENSFKSEKVALDLPNKLESELFTFKFFKYDNRKLSKAFIEPDMRLVFDSLGNTWVCLLNGDAPVSCLYNRTY